METPTPQPSAARDTSASEFSAAFPEQFTILGVKLLPLSLGRYRLMKFAEVAFVAEGEATATISDLFTGLAICGMRCDDFRAYLADGRLEGELRLWGKVLTKRIKREKGFTIFEKIGLFKAYVEQAQRLPWVALPVQGQDIPDGSLTHWSNNVEVFLRGKLGWSKQEIDEEPLTKALADYFICMENEGRVRLMPHELYQEMLDEGAANMRILEKMTSNLRPLTSTPTKEGTCPA